MPFDLNNSDDEEFFPDQCDFVSVNTQCTMNKGHSGKHSNVASTNITMRCVDCVDPFAMYCTSCPSKEQKGLDK